MAINNKDGETADEPQIALAEQVAALRQQTEALQRRVEALERRLEGVSPSEAERGDAALAAAPDVECPEAAEEKPAAGRRIAILAGHAAYYLALAMLIVGAVLLRSAQSGAPVSVAGYCGMVVLSGSMQDVIPQDSFIITHRVDASTLQVGDDITFMASADTCVTHRIIEINRQTDGTLSFRTKGTNNQSPDSDPVPAVNVVGKVIYHNLWLGQTAQWIRQNWPLVIFLLAVWTVLSWFLTRSLKADEEEAPRKEKPKESTSAESGAHAAEKRKLSIKIRKKEKQSNGNSDKEEAQPQDDVSHCRGSGTGDHVLRHVGVAEHQPEGEERG